MKFWWKENEEEQQKQNVKVFENKFEKFNIFFLCLKRINIFAPKYSLRDDYKECGCGPIVAWRMTFD